jgi:hypothetical protein
MNSRLVPCLRSEDAEHCCVRSFAVLTAGNSSSLRSHPGQSPCWNFGDEKPDVNPSRHLVVDARCFAPRNHDYLQLALTAVRRLASSCFRAEHFQPACRS